MPRALEESGETLGRPGMAAMTMGESFLCGPDLRRPGGAEVTEGVQPVEVEVAHPRQHGVDVPRGAPVARMASRRAGSLARLRPPPHRCCPTARAES